MALSSQITRRLKAPFAVILTAALVGMGGGVAFAEDTTPPPPTSSASASVDTAQNTSDADAKATTTTEQKKSFICKYVGNGVDERLQSGQNPILRDRKDGDVIGTFFNDNQGRSVVIGFGNPGDPDMSISDCPAPPNVPDPVVTTTTETRNNCDSGFVQERTVATTRTYTWQGTSGWVLGDPVVTTSDWTNTSTAASGCTVPTPKDATGDFTLTGVCGVGNDTVATTQTNATAVSRSTRTATSP